MCQTLISSGDYYSLMFWLSLVELRCSTPVTTQDERSFNFLIKNKKDTKNEGQKDLFIEFPRPQLPQASLWLAWALK